MLLSARDAIDAFPFIARRYGVTAQPSEAAVRAALDAARALASGDPSAETAAVFNAFANYRRAFAGAWRIMAIMLARSQARTNGQRVAVDHAAMDALCSEIMHRRVGFDDVRSRFAVGLVPLVP